MDYLIEYPGDPRHEDHALWLSALGNATLAAARLSGIAFDLLRILGGIESSALYSDPLGTLETRLRGLSGRRSDLPGLAEFIADLAPARETRNDLLHALPVLHGLHRRKTTDLAYVRDFFTVESLNEAADEMHRAADLGNGVLYRDGGEAVRAWYASQGS